MKRFLPYLACLAGIAALALLIPQFNAAQPHGIRLTRGQAQTIADREARLAGIPVDSAWSVMTWSDSGPLEEVLRNDPALRRRAADDPVIGPRLGGYKATYYRRGLEKFQPYGEVVVSAQTGEILMRRVRMRNEDPGARLEEAEIRRRADAFVQSRTFIGSPSPQFEDARPTRQRNRTDWIVRYRIPSKFPTGAVVPYLWVAFTGDKLGGWSLIEEYSDGRAFRGEQGSEVAGLFLTYGCMYAMLVVLLWIFLKKYHAGEVGVRTASLLLGVLITLSLVQHLLTAAATSEGIGMGGMAARETAWARVGFVFLLFDLPAAEIGRAHV